MCDLHTHHQEVQYSHTQDTTDLTNTHDVYVHTLSLLVDACLSHICAPWTCDISPDSYSRLTTTRQTTSTHRHQRQNHTQQQPDQFQFKINLKTNPRPTQDRTSIDKSLEEIIEYIINIHSRSCI